MRRFYFVLFCLAGFSLLPLAAVEGTAAWASRAWQTRDGLPDNTVTGVVQLPDGYLLVATLGGLMRFDGVRFEEISLLHIPGVENRVVRNMLLDRRGRLWLAMDRGSVLCVSSNEVRLYGREDGLENTRVTSLIEDGAGTVWLMGSGALYRVVDGALVRSGSVESFSSGASSRIAVDGAGDVVMTRGNQALVYRNDNWEVRHRFDEGPVRLCAARDGGNWFCAGRKVLRARADGSLEERGRLPDAAVATVLVEDSRGVLWIGTASDGLFRLDAEGLGRADTSHRDITCAAGDHEGNFWVGTAGGGLNLLQPRAIDLLDEKSGLPSESVRSVCQDAAGSVWVVMNNGALLRGNGKEWRAVTAEEGWPGGNVICVTAGRAGGVWIGTRDRGVQFLREGKCEQWGRAEGLGANFVRSILAARNGDVWIGIHAPDQVVLLRDGKFFPQTMPGEVRDIRALAEGTDGTIWAGTSGGQLLRAERGTMVAVQTEAEARSRSVRTLRTTADGSLWIGYAGWGVGRLWNGKYARLTKAQGLHDDYISQIETDEKGGVWFTSNHGLFQTRWEDLVAVSEGRLERVRCIVYGRSAGLPSFQPTHDNSPTSWRMQDGLLCFATRNGLLTVRPRLVGDNLTPPPMVLERVSVDDQAIGLWNSGWPLRPEAERRVAALSDAGGALKIPPGHRKVEFDFTALSFASPENVSFRYRLKNFDETWSDGGGERLARYPHLPPGRYEFQVKACNNAGVWSEPGLRQALVVSPFYWQTRWFQAGALVLFTAAVVGLVRLYSFQRLRRRLAGLEQQEVLQRERTRIARDMHDEVGSKLSRLSLLSEMAGRQEGSNPAARAEVAEISETARDTIRSFEEIVWAVNPKNDSLEHLINYLCRFAEDFFEGSPTQCVFAVPERLPDWELPTGARHQIFLAGKEALNNVFKHAGASRVCVGLTLGEDFFSIQIEDDGRGWQRANETSGARRAGGNGLDNMGERMRQVGGEFEIAPAPGGGTRVTLTMKRTGGKER